MKKILFLVVLTLISSCSVDPDANEKGYDRDLRKLSEADFKDFMDQYIVENDIVDGSITDEISTFSMNSIQSDVKNGLLGLGSGLIDGSLGACLQQTIKSGDEEYGKFSITKTAHRTNLLDNTYELDFEANGDWLVYAINMNITTNCANTPVLSSGEPNVNYFNNRNRFNCLQSNVKYKLDKSRMNAACYCFASYVILYKLNDAGTVERCVGAWVDGTNFKTNSPAKTNTFCHTDCTEVVQDN